MEEELLSTSVALQVPTYVETDAEFADYYAVTHPPKKVNETTKTLLERSKNLDASRGKEGALSIGSRTLRSIGLGATLPINPLHKKIKAYYFEKSKRDDGSHGNGNGEGTRDAETTANNFGDSHAVYSETAPLLPNASNNDDSQSLSDHSSTGSVNVNTPLLHDGISRGEKARGQGISKNRSGQPVNYNNSR
jgi:hypothetical protein